MNGSDLERRLVAVLQRHAEDAMQHTNTEARLTTLLGDAERATRRRRRGLVAAALVAAAAVAIALIVWAPGLGSDRKKTSVPAQVSTAESVAMAFVNAYASFERDRAASYLAKDTYVDNDSDWLMANRWYEAVGFKMLLGSCEEQGRSPAGTLVRCPYAFHCLHSEDLGRGPFADNAFVLTVRKGEIVAAEQDIPFLTNGFSRQMWEPFAAWVAKAHPKDGMLMYVEWPDTSVQALTERSIVLWALHSREYAQVARTGDPSTNASP